MTTQTHTPVQAINQFAAFIDDLYFGLPGDVCFPLTDRDVFGSATTWHNQAVAMAHVNPIESYNLMQHCFVDIRDQMVQNITGQEKFTLLTEWIGAVANLNGQIHQQLEVVVCSGFVPEIFN